MEGSPKGLRKGAWTAEEDSLLRQCIDKYGEGKWQQVPLGAGMLHFFLLRTHTQTQIYVINYSDYFLPLCLLFGTLFKTGGHKLFFFF